MGHSVAPAGHEGSFLATKAEKDTGTEHSVLSVGQKYPGQQGDVFSVASVEAALVAEAKVESLVAPRSTRKRLSGQIGFRPAHPRLYRAYNVAVSLFLVTLALPLLIVIAAALLITQGRGILYRGPRLGIDARPFNIYKFRTLNTSAAAEMTKDRTLPRNSGLETPLGHFLRETRLDELPQIFNVLIGDMNLCGPRPVRPEIAQIESRRIPGYDVRYTVKPGLVGPAQALMSHGTSKRVRALFNNIACRRRVSMRAELSLLSMVAWAVVRRSVAELYFKVSRFLLRALSRLLLRIMHALRAADAHEAAASERARPYRLVQVALPGTSRPQAVEICDDRLLLIPGLRRLPAEHDPEQDYAATLIIHLLNGGQRKARVVLKPTAVESRFSYVATSGSSAYLVERYLLGLTVLSPARRRSGTLTSSRAGYT